MKCIYLVFIFISCNMFIAGQDSAFTIQSFKPENIKESQVLIRADNNYNKSSGERNELNDLQKESENNRQQAGLRTSVDWKFKYETPKILLYSDVSTMLDYRNKRSYYSSVKDDAVPDQPVHSFYERKLRGKKLIESIDFTLLGSRYFKNKLGAMAYSDFSISMSQDDYFHKYENIRFEIKDNSSSLTQRFSEGNRESSERRASLTMMVGPFYGKIYEGYYAAKAIELISELSEKGQLISKPSDNQMKQLARIIYEEMNRYYYDSRIKRIESLERITAFLVSKNIIGELISTYLTILDIYQYSDAKYNPRYGTSNYLPSQLYKRPHGFLFGMLLGIDYREINNIKKESSTGIYYRTEYDSLWQITYSDTINATGPSDGRYISNGSGSKELVLFAEYARPFGWHWHLITDVEISIFKDDTTNLHLLGEGETTQIYVDNYGYNGCKIRNGKNSNFTPTSASLGIQLQYFLNSRTKFELYHRAVFSKVNKHYSITGYSLTDSGDVETVILYDKNYKSLNFTIGISGTYYFTPRISIIGNLSYYFRKAWDMNYSSDNELFDSLNFLREENKNNSFYFSVNINYYIL